MHHYDYTSSDIKIALKKAGLKKNMDVFIHSNLSFFGIPKFKLNVLNVQKYFIHEIKKIIGFNGTIIVPTFTYSYCNNEIYDPKKINNNMGLFSQSVQLEKNSLRSNDPIFSVCAIGKKAKEYTYFFNKRCFGDDSFWSKFLENNGFILGLNFGVSCTIFHYFEWLLNVPYRFEKKFSGYTLLNNCKIKTSVIYFCRNLRNKKSKGNFLPIEHFAKNQNYKKVVKLGKGYLSLSNSKKIFSLFKKYYKKDKYFLTIATKYKNFKD